MRAVVEEALKTAPTASGCYLFLDCDGEALYVGKARNLRRRVQVYRRDGADGRPHLAKLASEVASVEFRVTDSEFEAILLEDQLVKLHRPRRNILLKDDKAFLLLEIDPGHPFPRLGLARRRQAGREAFGPYPDTGTARRAFRLLQRAFGLRDCSNHTLAHRRRSCLKHAIGMCLAPCVDAVTESDYADAVERARRVLAGETEPLVARERERMEQASAAFEYEVALRARNRMRALEALATPQHVRLHADRDFDVLGIDERGRFAVLEYREGDWVGSRRGAIPLVQDPSAMVAELLVALYRDGAEIPPTILVPACPDGVDAIATWLAERAGGKVALQRPQRGRKRALVRMAVANARAEPGERAADRWEGIAIALGDRLGIEPPRVVDAIDVSHLQGKERVASRVRFVDGRPDRASYRRYLVAGGAGNDDYAAMEEVVARMLRRSSEDGLADLVVLDGGAGQLAAGLRAAASSEAEPVLCALAKARKGAGALQADERLYLPGESGPIPLAEGSDERLFLERLRDEAHRFAVFYHRRRRENVRLLLEEVPGIGPARRKTLLNRYRSTDAIRDADPVELAGLTGIGPDLAEAVQEHLRRRMP